MTDFLKYSCLVFALAIAVSTLTGCQSLGNRLTSTTVPVAMKGHVHGGQQPVANSLIQLYAVGETGVGSAAQPLVSQPVYTDDGGNFSLTGLYTCPTPETAVYLTSTGGNNSPGLTGSPNPAIALMTMLGPCGALTDATYVTINEVTTIGSIWPLASYMTSPTQLGSNAGDGTFASALASVNEFVNTGDGSSPGTATTTSYFGDPAKLYSLADAVASCINSTGGTAGDGSWCGNLFAYGTESNGVAPTDTITAALHIAQNPTLNVNNIFGLVPPTSPFEPSLTTAPSDWTLTLTSLSGAPVTPPSSGGGATTAAITISVPSPSITIGSTLKGTITLGSPAPLGGVIVALVSSSSNVIAVSPTSVNVLPGQTSAIFNYTATALGTSTITASASGYTGGSAQVTPTALHSYYVANSGSDANNGTSPSTPWKTLAKLNTATLVPGDAAYLQCGSTFRESLTILRAGSAGLPITYGPYGSCSGSGLPLISGADLLSGWTAEGEGSFTAYYARETSVPNIVFEDSHRLPMQSAKTSLTPGTSFYDSSHGRVYVRSREDGNPGAHVMEASVRKSSISGYQASYVNLNQIEADKNTQNGVTFTGTLSNVTLTGMVTNYSKANGVYFTANTGETRSNLLIQNGTANYNGGDGVSKGNGGTNVVISGYLADYNGFDPANTFSGGIRIVSDGTTDANRPTYSGIQNSTADFNGVDPDTGAKVSDTTGSGVGVWCDTCGNGSFVKNNEGHGNTQAGAQLEWTGANGSQSMTGNVEYNNFYGILHARRSHNDVIANNTTWDNFINCRFSGDGDTTVGMVNNTYANNICGSKVWNGSGYVVQVINGAENNSLGQGSGNVFSNNSFGVPSATNGIFAQFGAGRNMTGYSQLDAAYGSSMRSMTQDPMLTNPTAGDFSLMPGSPAIGAGLWGKDLGAVPYNAGP